MVFVSLTCTKLPSAQNLDLVQPFNLLSTARVTSRELLTLDGFMVLAEARRQWWLDLLSGVAKSVCLSLRRLSTGGDVLTGKLAGFMLPALCMAQTLTVEAPRQAIPSGLAHRAVDSMPTGAIGLRYFRDLGMEQIFRVELNRYAVRGAGEPAILRFDREK